MELIIFIWLQGAGKSTYYRQFLSGTHVHVSKDLMRKKKKREERQRAWIETAFRAGRSVVVDNTNPSAAVRTSLIALAKAHGARVIGYFFQPDLAESLQRNRQRQDKDRVPDVAIYATSKALEPPSRKEGFDELFMVRLVNGAFQRATML